MSSEWTSLCNHMFNTHPTGACLFFGGGGLKDTLLLSEKLEEALQLTVGSTT